MLKVGLWLGLFAPFSLPAATKPRRIRPQIDDRLVHAFGDQKGNIIKPEDIKLDASPLLAYPKDVPGNIIRDRNRLNMVLVMRLKPGSVSKLVEKHKVEDLIVYSAVCTHTGCNVEGWNNEKQHMICPCHGSEFNPANGASVVLGPAPKPLAILPVKIENHEIIVSGKFTRKVGFQQKQ